MEAISTNKHMDLLKRHGGNPILRARDWPYRVNTVFNAGATRLATGETLLLCRVEDCAGVSHLCAARSRDGLGDWRIDTAATLPPSPDTHSEEEWGVEDPRVVFLTAREQYAVTYTAYSPIGPGVSLALTKDFCEFERLGMVLPVENKDAALFPDQFDGRWAMLHRPAPISVGGAHIWISFSPDLVHWGGHQVVLRARGGPWWDGSKIGLSTPPIRTAKGWLLLYHGVRSTVAGSNYYVGLALLDLQDPTKCIKRGREWIFGPRESYERSGDVDNVVFPCGHTIAADGDTLHVYYGAADTSIGVATGSIRQMLDWLHGSSD